MTDGPVHCPSCDAEIAAGALFCEACGTARQSDVIDEVPGRPSRSSATERTMALRAVVDPNAKKGKGTPLDAAAVANKRAMDEAERARRAAEEQAAADAKARREAEKAAEKDAKRRAAEEAAARKAAEKQAKRAASTTPTSPTTAVPSSMGVSLPVERPAGAPAPAPQRPPSTVRVSTTPTRPAAEPKPSMIDRVRATAFGDRAESASGDQAPWYMRTPGGPTKLPSAAREMAGKVAAGALVLALFVAVGVGIVILRPDGDAPSGDGTKFGVEPTTVQFPELPLASSRYADLIEGTGNGAEIGDTLTINYAYYTSNDGRLVDSSFSRNEPWTFQLGAGEVIPGLDRGLLGAKVAGRRQIDIIPELAYGDAGVEGVIAAGATLTFIVDVLSIVPGDGTVTTSSTSTSTTSTTQPPDPNETALAALTQLVGDDRAVADTLVGTWVLQLDLGYEGLTVDGVALDPQTILANHEAMRETLPVILIDPAQWQWPVTIDATSTVYITVVGLPFFTRTEARAWATNNGIARDDYELIAFPEPVA